MYSEQIHASKFTITKMESDTLEAAANIIKQMILSMSRDGADVVLNDKSEILANYERMQTTKIVLENLANECAIGGK